MRRTWTAFCWHCALFLSLALMAVADRTGQFESLAPFLWLAGVVWGVMFTHRAHTRADAAVAAMRDRLDRAAEDQRRELILAIRQRAYDDGMLKAIHDVNESLAREGVRGIMFVRASDKDAADRVLAEVVAQAPEPR